MIKTAAVIKNPTPANVIPSNVFSIIFLRKSASGIRGEVATPARSPTRTICSAAKTGATSAAPSNPRRPWAMARAVIDQDRGRRTQVEDHVEEQVLLAGLFTPVNQAKRFCVSSRWPSLETGKNSVIPCTTPRTSDSSHSINVMPP